MAQLVGTYSSTAATMQFARVRIIIIIIVSTVVAGAVDRPQRVQREKESVKSNETTKQRHLSVGLSRPRDGCCCYYLYLLSVSNNTPATSSKVA